MAKNILNIKRAGIGIKDGAILMGITAIGTVIAGPVGGIAGSFLASRVVESPEVKGFAFALAAVQAGTLIGSMVLGGIGGADNTTRAGPSTVSNPVF